MKNKFQLAIKQQLNWVDPQLLAQKIADNYGSKSWIYLHSALSDEVENSCSIIALFPRKELILDDLKELENLQKENITNAAKYDGCWFGYISYEYSSHLEKIPKTKKSFVDLAKIHLINFSLIFEFNHDKKTLEAYFSKQKFLEKVLCYSQDLKLISHPFYITKFWKKNLGKIFSNNFFCNKKSNKLANKLEIKVSNLSSNFSNESYLSAIEDIKKMIVNGDIYQTNLTRKFFGNINIARQKDYFNLFTKLITTSPANYFGFIKYRDLYIISSSPELFFSVNNGVIVSRPIKGTAPRGNSSEEDEENKKYLQNSIKEQAENLMIVDLMRNDLSRVCEAGSVIVKNLFRINTYKTLHHMSSEIIGKISADKTIFDVFKACFPAGSMTGAPKIKAMEIAAKKEKINRGIYSGAIGYLGRDSANFSVVIRTIICRKNKFEFQVGGAITFDSNPQTELEETLAKAKAIMKVLNLNEADLQKLNISSA